jgi:hypothetical protein
VTAYRCDACGNKTRFDVVEAKRVRSFLHFTLGGEPTVEEEEILELTIEKVLCRWCGASLPVSGAMEVPAAPRGRDAPSRASQAVPPAVGTPAAEAPSDPLHPSSPSDPP